MDSLLDFSAPLNMAVLDELSDSFYRDGNKAAEAALVTFQRHPMAWTRAPQILEQSSKLSARILALNILEETVRTKWSVLPVTEREGIRTYIVSLIIRLSSQPPAQSAASLGLSLSDHSLYLRKCNVVLVALVKQDWPERWPSFIPELVASSKSSSSLCLNNMAILCVPEHDTRVLTNAGFLFLADIEARIDAGQPVLYACYDTSKQSIVYRPGQLTFPPAPPTRWVDFTHADTRRLWDPATSDDYGATEPASGVNANHLTLRTTPEHDMYVQLCTRYEKNGHEQHEPRMCGRAAIPAHKMQAQELAPGYHCDCDAAGRTCTHGYSHYRMYTGAACGLHSTADVLSLSDRDDPHSPVAQLGLHSKDELAAFLELFGYWLGDGSMSYHSRAGLSSNDALCFAPRQSRDRAYLRSVLARLRLVCGQHYSSNESELRLEVRITEPRWFRFFDDEFGVAYSASRHYDRRLALLKQAMHSAQRRPSTASSVSASATVSSTRARRRLSSSESVELAADSSGEDDEEDSSPCEVDPVDDDAAAPTKWLPDWSLFRLESDQLRLVIEGLRQAAGRQAAAAGGSEMQSSHVICTSSVGFRDQLVQACLHAGYSAYFELNSRAGDVCGYQAAGEQHSMYSQQEMEAALRVDSTLQFKPVRGKHDSWSVCYSEAVSELLPAQDVRFDGGVSRLRQQAVAIATQPADLYDRKRDGRVWCVDVEHDDHLIFVQRAHRNASGVVTKAGRNMIVGNCLLSEEVFDYSAGVLTEGKSREMKQHLSSSFTLIFTLCDDVMEQQQHIEPQLLHATLSTTLRFLHWIPVGYIFETRLCERLSTLFLLKPSCCNISMQCLTEVAAVKLTDEQSDKYQHILLNTFAAVVKHAQQHLQQQLQALGGHVAAAAMQASLSRWPLAELYAETDNSDVQDYLRYLTLFLSSFLRTHVALLERTADSSRVSVVVALQLLLSLSAIDEAVIFKICLEYWNWMVTMLYDNTRMHHSSGRQQLSAAQQSPFQLLATAPAATSAATSASLLPSRLSYYAPILHDLRLVLISKMAKPEEVMIVEDENGQIVRELLKDSDSVVLYKSMREALIYLTHLNPDDTQATMLEKLEKQVDGSEWSWRNLNTVCWAIGSISGALSEQAEKNFLVKVIKDLLHFTEVKRGKDNKAVIASNIMYVVGQYPRFLKQHWKFLKTVCNKLFEFMHESHEGVADMSVDTFLKIAKKCKKKFVVQPSPTEQPFIEEMLLSLPGIISDLQGAQVCVFYEATAELVSAETDSQKSAQLIAALMQQPNTQWSNIMQMAQQAAQQGITATSPLTPSSPLPLTHPTVVKQLLAILRINVRVCSSLGSSYMPQLARLFVDLLRVYVTFSEHVQARISTDGPNVVRHADVRGMRAVKKEVCSLFLLFVQSCSEPQLPLLLSSFLPQLMEPLCDDYKRSTGEARETEVLTLAAALIKRLSSPSAQASAAPSTPPLASYIPRFMQSLFLPTLPMITNNFTDYVEHRTALYTLLLEVCTHQFGALLQSSSAQHFQFVIDSVLWAMKHLDRGVQEQGADILLQLLQHIAHSQHGQHFYTTYFIRIVSETLGLLTDTLHKAAITKHAQILQRLFHLVEAGSITLPLWDTVPPGSSPDDFANNQAYVRSFVIRLLCAAFPHLSRQQVAAFTAGLFTLHLPDKQQEFKSHIRDFLITIKEWKAHEPADGQAGHGQGQQQHTAGQAGLQPAGGGRAGDDNEDLFADEREAAAEAERKKEQDRLSAVPGLIYNPAHSVVQQQQQQQQQLM